MKRANFITKECCICLAEIESLESPDEPELCDECEKMRLEINRKHKNQANAICNKQK